MTDKPENMNEPAHQIGVEGRPAPFEPENGRAIFFIDDHGNSWVRFKVLYKAPNYGLRWVCVPRERVLWITQ